MPRRTTCSPSHSSRRDCDCFTSGEYHSRSGTIAPSSSPPSVAPSHAPETPKRVRARGRRSPRRGRRRAARRPMRRGYLFGVKIIERCERGRLLLLDGPSMRSCPCQGRVPAGGQSVRNATVRLSGAHTLRIVPRADRCDSVGLNAVTASFLRGRRSSSRAARRRTSAYSCGRVRRQSARRVGDRQADREPTLHR